MRGVVGSTLEEANSVAVPMEGRLYGNFLQCTGSSIVYVKRKGCGEKLVCHDVVVLVPPLHVLEVHHTLTYHTNCPQYILILHSLVFYSISTTFSVTTESTSIFTLTLFDAFLSFITITTGNIMDYWGWWGEISTAVEIIVRSVEYFV